MALDTKSTCYYRITRVLFHECSEPTIMKYAWKFPSRSCYDRVSSDVFSLIAKYFSNSLNGVALQFSGWKKKVSSCAAVAAAATEA